MRKFRTIAAALVLLVLFAGAHMMLGLPTHIEIINGVTIFAMVAIIGVYSPLWAPSLRGHMDPSRRLGLGIGLLAFSILSQRVWSTIWRVSHFPEWMREHWFVALSPFLGIVACALLITVPSDVDGQVQRRSWILLLCSIAFGAAFAGFVVGLNWGDYVVATLPP